MIKRFKDCLPSFLCKKIKPRHLICSVLVFFSLAGCASKSAVRIMPTADLKSSDRLYVISNTEDSDRKLRDKIITSMKMLGFQVFPYETIQTDISKTNKIAISYTFVKSLTGNFLELSISFREVGSNFPVAHGRVIDSEINGKSEEQMIDEIITKIVYGRKGY